jgi:hypothetical protein
MSKEIIYNDQPDLSLFDASKNAIKFNWDFGDGDESDLQNPTHTYQAVGARRILQTVYNQYNCTDTLSRDVMVALGKIFPPNAFCPNSINLSDQEFLLFSNGVMPNGYHVRILSRWNDLIYECKDKIQAWDGKLANGDWAPPGTYVWILNYTDFLGTQHKQTGTVTLIF